MHVTHLSLHDFRSYPELELPLEPGASAFIGANGQGKTNLVEAIDYLATLGSHRVAADAPLVRVGAERAVVRASVVRDDRSALLEIEITPGRSNRARVNRGPLPRPRDLLGWLRSVVFSPEDLRLVKGDPSDRRQFLDALLVLRSPRFAGVRADYDRALRQRNSLLKSARRSGHGRGLETLDVWDDQLATYGGELLAARLALLDELAPYLGEAYRDVAASAAAERTTAAAAYKPSFELPDTRDREVLRVAMSEQMRERRRDEIERGVSLVGPHRDDVVLSLGDLPAKGYASHGESWSYALALRLASYDLLRADGDDPILILDDVFAELDRDRRSHLAARVTGAEQVLVTAAVADDVPVGLRGHRYEVASGKVVPVEGTTDG
ncbi:DNA replication/repair protein RecF [Mumia sp. zg.B53]|uniref:DNA replication/repair protein RecF n=1 Tax=unclassified Mumia TaxID=2621872 RepID=UPI001C6E2AC9|nr:MULTISPECIES: DNA replication/repair protein RecF [unclassified Mumia]MBW9207718.1 DNA replication/repair protein RecF [Mumia sp. zg.B17]MBW9209936.1 DNA replication/repair protein RecF [Mumia sp. zg.B21]MBW9214540.1 DNA replication/repair protein RecF [Mumia sp. zg.B53]MDD9347661.1 DNA replication/repair protein RecF [Mumia sp.]